MEETVKQFGFPAIFLVMVAKMIFDFLGKQKKQSPLLEDVTCPLNDHRVEDVLTKLSENMVRQTTILQRMEEDNREIVKGMHRVETKVDTISERPHH